MLAHAALVLVTLVVLGSLILAGCGPATSSSAGSSAAPADNRSSASDRVGTLRNEGTTGPAVQGMEERPLALRQAPEPARSAGPATGRSEPAGPPAQPRGTTPSGTAGTPPVDDTTTQLPVVASLGRMIIYTTDLVLVVDSLDALPAHLGTIALAHGGYVAGIETKEESGIPITVVRVRIAPTQYEAAMQAIRSLAVEVREEKAATRDVTEEHNDVATQIASLEATHAQLLRLQERTGSIEEVLRVQQQAAQVKGQIDRLKGRLTAMERLSELATITVKAYLAGAILPRDYTTLRTAIRRAEANRAALESQLQRVRTPDEEATLRDRLGETVLEVTRLQGRLTDLEAKAAAARVTLPAVDPAAGTARLDETLPREYIQTRVALRRAQHDQAELTRALREGQAVDPSQLTELVIRINQLEGQVRTIQERARLAGVTLPALSPEHEALLAGLPPAPRPWQAPQPIQGAWEGSLGVLTAIASWLVFVWWTMPLLALGGYLFLRRRAPRPATA